MGQEIPAVSEKSTKSVILAAHDKALKKLAEFEKNPRTLVKQEQDRQAIARVGQTTVESVVEDLAKTKLLVGSTLSDLESKLVNKRTQLEDLQRAISAEEENLKDVHGITRQADSFVALVQAQKDQKTAFEEEITEARARWNKETSAQAESFNEKRARLQEDFNRLREQYQYDFNKEKNESQDAFNVEKTLRERKLQEHVATVERDLKEREQSIRAQEAEFQSLRTQVEGFPAVLAERTAAAADEAKSRAEKSYGFEVRALKKDMDSAKALAEQQIANLKEQLSALTKERDSLRVSIEKSQAEVKEIATEAIKGAQQKNYYNTTPDKKVA